MGYNCLLPESHYYDVITSAGVFTWKTTNCYFKAIAVWTLMSMLLFIFYCAILILQLIFWYKNIESWRKSYKMVQYLPLQGASYLQNNALSDLHVLMAIINQNDQARKVKTGNHCAYYGEWLQMSQKYAKIFFFCKIRNKLHPVFFRILSIICKIMKDLYML